MADVALVAVLGTGEAACALARAAALAGCAVRLHAPDAGALEAAQARIRDAVEAARRAGALGPEDVQRTLDGILATDDLDEAVTHADLVVEAGASTVQARRAAFMALGQACRASAIVAATEGAPDDLVDWVPQPGRLVALRVAARGGRFEVEACVESSPHVLEAARRFAARLALTPGVGRGAERRVAAGDGRG